MQIDYADLRNGNNNVIIHLYRAPAHVTVEELLDSKTWVNVVQKLDKEHIIQVIWEDMSKECELRVISKRDKIVTLKLRGDVIVYDDTKETKAGKFRVEWRGKGKFCVFLDGSVDPILRGFDTKEEALTEAQKLAA